MAVCRTCYRRDCTKHPQSDAPSQGATAEAKRYNWFWPRIDDERSAWRATRDGMWLAFLIAGVTGVFASSGILGFAPTAFVDAVTAMFLGIGLYRQSRVAAIGSILFYLLNLTYKAYTHPGHFGNVVLAIVFTLGFVNALRGSVFHHRSIGSKVNWKHVLALSGLAVVLTVIATGVFVWSGRALERFDASFRSGPPFCPNRTLRGSPAGIALANHLSRRNARLMYPVASRPLWARDDNGCGSRLTSDPILMWRMYPSLSG